MLVHASQAEEAQGLLAETLVEGEQVDLTEEVHALHPDEMGRRKPRDYGLIGAYARALAWSFATLILVLAVFLLLRLV